MQLSLCIHLNMDTNACTLARTYTYTHTHTHAHTHTHTWQVGQSWLSTVWTTVVALLYDVCVVFREMPDIVMCNGPGTCVPVAYAAWLMRWVSQIS
jgi:hypothetical protein